MISTDIVSAWRVLRRRPGFSCLVVAEMALTIGACTAIFSIVNAVLFAPLPFKDAARLAIVWHTQANAVGVSGMSPHDYETYRDTTRAFESLAAVSTHGFNLSDGAEASRVTCERITSTLLPMLGVSPERGRWFEAGDDQPGAGRVAILSDELWRTRLGGRQDVLGSSVTLDGNPYTVVGVMPGSFAFPPEGIQGLDKASCWVPAAFTAADLSAPAFDQVLFAKRGAGVSAEQASDDASTVARRIWESYPPAVQHQVKLRARVVPLADQVVAGSKTAVLMFAGAVACLFLIGCANVANLTLAQLQGRQREMAIRAALGATRWSLTRQVLTESVILAVSGGVLGMMVAAALLRVAIAMSPGNVPRLAAAHLDMPTLLFAIGCAVGAGMLLGLVPGLRAGRSALAQGMAAGARGTSTAGLGRDRVRSTLVALELAMAVVLLIGAGLLVRSFLRVTSVTPGFNPDHVLTFSVALPAAAYPRADGVTAFVNDVLERLHRIPAVTDAAAGTSLPIGATDYTVVSRRGAPASAAGLIVASIQTVSPEFYSAYGIRLNRGRLLVPADDAAGAPVAVINDAMARQYWPDTDAIGKSLQWLAGRRDLTIVGVVADVHQAGLTSAVRPTFYIPIAQAPQAARSLDFAVRVQADPSSVAPSVRGTLTDVDRTLPIFGLQPASDILSHSMAPQRFNLFIVSAFATAALLLATLGLYAVISYVVGLSAREFGIRIALGSTASGILGNVMGRGMRLVGVGLGVGVLVAGALTRFMSSLLFGIQTTDAATFATVIALLAAVSAIAIAVPAFRATRVNPVLALRQE